jgi:hypothetical protein
VQPRDRQTWGEVVVEKDLLGRYVLVH